jgi:hypothetical protein
MYLAAKPLNSPVVCGSSALLHWLRKRIPAMAIEWIILDVCIFQGFSIKDPRLFKMVVRPQHKFNNARDMDEVLVNYNIQGDDPFSD